GFCFFLYRIPCPPSHSNLPLHGQGPHHLRRRRLATVTFFTTHGNAAFVREGLSGADDTAVVELAFPADVSGIPPGVESAEGLTSMASLAAFAAPATARGVARRHGASGQPPRRRRVPVLDERVGGHARRPEAEGVVLRHLGVHTGTAGAAHQPRPVPGAAARRRRRRRQSGDVHGA
uniref:Uncharacterized protein n=1 Tax=Aegilops tauschii subsp. strangulata TaxID=200361 RepID=A0A453J985_AEGTS